MRVSVGPSLDRLKHGCTRSLFNSTLDTTPQSFANYQWLQSAHFLDDGTIVALVHNEFHGWEVPNPEQ